MQELVTRAKELLADGTVVRVLGWRAGDMSYNPEPAFFENEDEMAKFQKWREEYEEKERLEKEEKAKKNSSFPRDFITTGMSTASFPQETLLTMTSVIPRRMQAKVSSRRLNTAESRLLSRTTVLILLSLLRLTKTLSAEAPDIRRYQRRFSRKPLITISE